MPPITSADRDLFACIALHLHPRPGFRRFTPRYRRGCRGAEPPEQRQRVQTTTAAARSAKSAHPPMQPPLHPAPRAQTKCGTEKENAVFEHHPSARQPKSSFEVADNPSPLNFKYPRYTSHPHRPAALSREAAFRRRGTAAEPAPRAQTKCSAGKNNAVFKHYPSAQQPKSSFEVADNPPPPNFKNPRYTPHPHRPAALSRVAATRRRGAGARGRSPPSVLLVLFVRGQKGLPRPARRRHPFPSPAGDEIPCEEEP